LEEDNRSPDPSNASADPVATREGPRYGPPVDPLRFSPARRARARSLATVAPLALVVLPVAALALVAPGCGSDGTSTPANPTPTATGTVGGDAAPDRRLPGIVRPTASCPVELESPDVLASPHVPEGTQVTYNSNPPSSGPHFPAWANFQEFDKPIERGFLVHSLEHGAVVLLYKCDSPTGPGCADLVEGLRQVRTAAATDNACDPSIRVRVIIAPDPNIDKPISATAWGFTYKADCVDAPTLSTFVRENYARGPENFCTPGRTF